MMGGGYDDSPNDPQTMRGRDWPCLRQFCVFMENRVGRLNDLLRHIEREDLRVMALSVVDTVDFAVARILVDNTDRVRELLSLSDFTVTENDIVGVELPDDPQPFLQIFRAIVSAEINISYTYPLLYRRGGRGAIALHVDNVDQATQLLQSLKFRVLTESDLMQDDEFF
ncbi:MAG: acetolactate synthase [Planctomycetaceae bacterium]